MIVSSLANAREIKCSTLSTEMHGTLTLGEINLTLDSKKRKKNSVVEKSESANASVGQTPTQAAASVPVAELKLGRLSTRLMESGQISIHFVHWENLLLALTQALTSKCKPIDYASSPQCVDNASFTYSKSLSRNSKASSAPSWYSGVRDSRLALIKKSGAHSRRCSFKNARCT